MAAWDWYDVLPSRVCRIIDGTGFGVFCYSLTRVTASRTLLGALVERWCDTTNSFHFSTAGEMTMNLVDFAMITGLGVVGDPIPLDADMGEWVAAWDTLLGARQPTLRAGMLTYTWFEAHYRGEDPDTDEEVEQYARGFLLFLFGTTLFSNGWNTVGFYFLGALVVLQGVCFYDWGMADLTTLYGYMSSTSRMCGRLIGGYWRGWELWVYAYFPALALEPVEETATTVPFSDVYDSQLRRRTQESFIFFRQYFDMVTAREITWQPWDAIPSGLRD
ncbi:protein MAIN-LIKE 2-like [Camellia sinensis]|uniref:protein MAIN-LIKE 2-like n=1 Tax=Camellia sinensis TaxID=4442 RepID=UPI001036815A|nr:protein MAIN-LIKE 2-like [Camellia sinensis]